jgi:hypothetical protein
VPSSAAQSRHGRIITRTATTAADTTDLDHIPTDRRLVAACGTDTLGYQLAKLKWAVVVDAVSAKGGDNVMASMCRSFFGRIETVMTRRAHSVLWQVPGGCFTRPSGAH